jgi:hypothetical protein
MELATYIVVIVLALIICWIGITNYKNSDIREKAIKEKQKELHDTQEALSALRMKELLTKFNSLIVERDTLKVKHDELLMNFNSLVTKNNDLVLRIHRLESDIQDLHEYTLRKYNSM